MNVICEVSKDCVSISKVDMRDEGNGRMQGKEIGRIYRVCLAESLV